MASGLVLPPSAAAFARAVGTDTFDGFDGFVEEAVGVLGVAAFFFDESGDLEGFGDPAG